MNVDWLKPAPDSIAGRHIGAGKIKALMLMNLVWIGWLFGDLIFSDERLPASWWYSTFCTLPFFLACYWLCYCRPAREIVRYALGMAALAFVLLWFNNSGASTYMIFLLCVPGFCADGAAGDGLCPGDRRRALPLPRSSSTGPWRSPSPCVSSASPSAWAIRSIA